MSKHRCEFCGRKVIVRNTYKYSYHTEQYAYYECKDCDVNVSYKLDLITIITIRFNLQECHLDIDFIKNNTKLFRTHNYKPIYQVKEILAITPQDAKNKIKTLLLFL